MTESEAIDLWRRRIQSTTTRRDGIYTVVGGPPCSCGHCDVCQVSPLISYIDELLGAIKASHETGYWGPVEDAYAASGRPCLAHREKTE